MALVPTVPLSESPLFAEVDMDSDSSAPTVRATVVQATTVFYDTPATLEDQVLVLLLVVVQLKAERISGSIMLQPLLFLIRKTAPKTFSFCALCCCC
ncbi:hypothetical protein Peur_073096 [Populus x canadensis]